MSDALEAGRVLDPWVRAYRAGPPYISRRRETPSLGEAERALFIRYARDLTSIIVTVGCGNGHETLALGRKGCENVIDVDLSEELLKVARETAAKMGLTVHFQQAHAGELPFEDASVDVVMLFTNVLGHATPRARSEPWAEAASSIPFTGDGESKVLQKARRVRACPALIAMARKLPWLGRDTLAPMKQPWWLTSRA